MLLWWNATLSVPGKASQGKQQGRPPDLGAVDCSAPWELSIGSMVEAVYTLGLPSWHIRPGSKSFSHGLCKVRGSPLFFIYRVNECQLAKEKYLNREGSFYRTGRNMSICR